MKTLGVFLLTSIVAATSLVAAETVTISEFMASNARTLADEDGAYEDWVEIRNSGSTAVNLGGWFLTDDPGDLTKWEFPATNLNAGGFLVVFASNKDRKVAGGRLHTNFRLSADGDYLALVHPDGISIATEFSPVFPEQVPDVSYGFGVLTSNSTLVAVDAAVRVRVPASGADGTNWLNLGFNDSSWTAGTNGVGFGSSSVVNADYGAAVLTTQPVGYWRLNESSGTTATNSGSGAGFNATYTASPTLGSAGPRPPAFSGFEPDNNAPGFNGASSYVAGPNGLLSNRGAFTVGGWIYPLVTPAARTGLFGQNDCVEFGFVSGNTLECWTPSGGSVTGVPYPYSLNQWHHVVAVADGSSIRIYLDGQPAGIGGNAGVANYGASAFNFNIGGGGVQDATGNFFNGQIDEVFVHHRALSAAEVLSIYRAGTNAAGFNVVPFIATDVGPAMSNVNATAYIRIPFTISEPTNFSLLSLRMRYDDGFVAWINGNEVARGNAVEPFSFNSAATAAHGGNAVQEFRFGTNGLLAGANVLAIQGLNVTNNDTDFLIQAELVGVSVPTENPVPVYFTAPTPGNSNTGGTNSPGPAITEVTHAPNVPKDFEDLFVTARVLSTFSPLASVVLRYRIMFDSEIEVTMMDDGAHGDGATNDGVFGASIPASASTNGQMIRYLIRATDTLGVVSRWPLFTDPAGTAEYLGTIVDPTNVTSRLPIMHLFAPANVLGAGPPTTQTGADSQTGGRVSFFYDGEFYDNVMMNLRGNSTAGFNKKSHRVEFNREHRLRHPGPGGRIKNTSFVADYPDPTYMRQRLCYWLGNAFGLPSPFYYPVRLQLNGNFYQLANHNNVNGDELAEFLGLDPEGEYYKAGGQVTTGLASTGGFEKLIPRDGNNSSFIALAALVSETNSAGRRLTNLMDVVNIPEVINYMAVARWVHENDDVWANMTLQRDTFGTREWRIIPFDMNLSWGAIFYEGGDTTVIEGVQATNDQHKAFPLYGSSQALALSGPAGGYNRMYDSVFLSQRTREMFLRRLRTLMDTWIKPPGTPTNQLLLEPMIRSWRDEIAEEANRDRGKWAWPPKGGQCNFNPGIGVTNGVEELIAFFIDARRRHFYGKHSVTNTALSIGTNKAQNAGIPLPAPANAFVTITRVDFNPASANQEQEFICISNPTPYALDISGWKIGGGVDFTFAGGTILTANSVLYVSPNTFAFRSRTVSPRGGEANFVVGPYQGQLSARGEPLVITDPLGRVLNTFAYAGNPSLVQQYLRVSEIMYHPAPPNGGPYTAEDFEYIELKNISTNVTLSLAGVRLTNGIVFDFTGSAVTSLGPGQLALVVRNSAAFTNRYGALGNIAGQYSGFLDNSGDRIRLLDSSNEEVLDFDYNNNWYPITDGLGFALAVVSDDAEPDAWDTKAQWRPSGQLSGSPGVSDPGPPAIAPIVVNEVLSRSDNPPPTDSIELYNPTGGDVNIGGWFMTDDFNTPKKFRIPNGTMILAGDYRVFNESDFNPTPGTPPSFALSSDNDEIYLFSADQDENLTGYFHGFDFGAADDGVTFGRYQTSDGREVFPAQSALTLGATNAGPRVGPIVINEVMYRPLDAGGADNSLDEYVELLNTASTNVPLYDVAAPTHTWKVTGGVEFTFPSNIMTTPGEYLLLVNFDPATNGAQAAAFRARFGVSAGVQLLGPYNGKLNNDEDNVELKRPTTMVGTNLPYVLIDKLSYEDKAPWPPGADGTGLSLQRKDSLAYGNDPANWTATIPTAAAATTPGGATPVITSQPANQSVLAGMDAMLMVAATGGAPLQYQWTFNGTTLPGATSSILLLTNVQPEQFGVYEALVFNSSGSAVSSNATLNVLLPVSILSQPLNQAVRPPNGASFSVVAFSSSPITYQWRFNGAPLTGETNSVLTIASVQPPNGGTYDVVVSDNVGPVISTPATLTVLIDPIIVQNPLSQTVVTNGNVTLSVVITNTATLPLGYQWRRGNTRLALNIQNSYVSVFTVTNVNAGTNSTTANTNWTVIVTNVAKVGGNISSQVFLTILADSDGDGIPDVWEAQYPTAGNPEDDLDDDGMSTREEFIAGTNPTNGLSYLKVEQISPGVSLNFNAISNRTYTVQFTTNLTDAAIWQKLIDVAARTTNWPVTVSDPSPASKQRTYRLVTPGEQ